MTWAAIAVARSASGARGAAEDVAQRAFADRQAEDLGPNRQAQAFEARSPARSADRPGALIDCRSAARFETCARERSDRVTSAPDPGSSPRTGVSIGHRGLLHVWAASAQAAAQCGRHRAAASTIRSGSAPAHGRPGGSCVGGLESSVRLGLTSVPSMAAARLLGGSASPHTRPSSAIRASAASNWPTSGSSGGDQSIFSAWLSLL